MVVDEPSLGVSTPLRCSQKSRRTPPEVLQCPSRTAPGISKLIHYHLGFMWNRVPPRTPKSARSSSKSHEIAVLGGIPHPQTHPFGFLSSRWLGYPTMLKMSNPWHPPTECIWYCILYIMVYHCSNFDAARCLTTWNVSSTTLQAWVRWLYPARMEVLSKTWAVQLELVRISYLLVLVSKVCVDGWWFG